MKNKFEFRLNIERKIAQEKMAALELRESEMRRKGHLNLKDMEPVSLLNFKIWKQFIYQLTDDKQIDCG